jgi:hypothetical protein
MTGRKICMEMVVSIIIAMPVHAATTTLLVSKPERCAVPAVVANRVGDL